MKIRWLLPVILGVWAAPADAQRAAENAVTAAEDAFGTSIGAQTTGLYDSSRVRGFSPIAAGNARIDGLYFDQVFGMPGRVQRSTTIRVGLSALGFPFPSPTGVVDYALRLPGDEASLSSFTTIRSSGAGVQEVDAVLPVVPGRLSLGAGLGLYRNVNANGTDSSQYVAGLIARWTPSTDVEIVPFWARSDLYGAEVGPIYIPAGPFLPPRVQRRRYDGPDWPRYSGAAMTYGAIARYRPAAGWTIRAGFFRSLFDDNERFANLIAELNEDGTGRQTISASPPALTVSTSGELRLTRSIADGPRLHILHAAMRGRIRDAEYGGSDLIDIATVRLGERVDFPEPVFRFSEPSRDRVRQWTTGIAYEGRWPGVGEISLGVQRTDYNKRVSLPGLPVQATDASPWLYNATVAVQIAPRLVVYAGYARGLEESGIAPASALNRDEPLPAILTSQRDTGIRWTITERLRLVAGLFDVRKPYFNLDAANLFTLLGDVRHQGVELSLAGALTPRLSIVAGAVVLRARVTGEGVALGRVGPLPVGQAARTLRLDADWRAPVLDGLSLTLGIDHLGRVPATRENLVFLPARTFVNVGGRYQFRLGRNPASARLLVSNLFDTYAFELRGSGAYGVAFDRTLNMSLAIDY